MIHASDIVRSVNEIHISKTEVCDVNRSELRAEFARQGISNRTIAKELDISEQAFYNKMNGESEFKESEIKKLIQLLGLSASDVDRIFLSENVN